MQDLNDVPMIRLLGMNAPEWKSMVIGCLGAMVNGSCHPVLGILLAEIISVSNMCLFLIGK